MKKLLSIVIALTVLMSAMTVGVTSVSAKKRKITPVYSGVIGKCFWDLNKDNGTLTISGKGEFKGNNNDWKKYGIKSKIKNVVIKSGITAINKYAFAFLDNMKAVSIPDTVKSIGVGSFEGVGIESITIPDSVETIGNDAFYECFKLKNVKLSSKLKTIGDNAFYDCRNLKSIKIPDGAIKIGEYAFSNCNSLEKIVLSKNLKDIKEGTFYGCSRLKTINFPKKLTCIGDYAFMYCENLKCISLGDNVTNIGNCAFEKCLSLKTITLPKKLATLGSEAFRFCSNLSKVNYSSGIKNIDDSVFFETAFFNNKNNWKNGGFYLGDVLLDVKENISGTLKVKEGTKVIAPLEDLKNITTIEMPDSVANVGEISNCTNLTSIKFSKNLKTFGGLDKCDKIKTLDFPEGVTSIDGIYHCDNLNKLELSDTLKKIGDIVDCKKLEEIRIPESVTNIGDFVNCKALETINIPQGVTTIGDIYLCNNLKKLELSDTLKKINEISYNNKLEELKIPESVTAIKTIASCNNLSKITLPSTLKEVPYVYDTAYDNNSSNWEDGLLYIGNYLVASDKNKINENVIIKNGTTKFAENAFYNNTKIKSISIPASVEYIPEKVFDGCENLTKIKVDSNNKHYKSVDGSLYSYDMTNLIMCTTENKSFTVPDGVKEISLLAIDNLKNIRTINIPVSVTDMLTWYGPAPLKFKYEGTYSQWKKIDKFESDDFNLYCKYNLYCKKDPQKVSVPSKITLNGSEGKFAIKPFAKSGYTLKSLDSSIATIDKKGIVTPKAEGTVTIRIKAGNKYYKTVTKDVTLVIKGTPAPTPTPDDDTDVNRVKAKTIKFVKTSPRRGYITFKAPKNVTGYKLYFKSDYKGLVKKYNNTIYTNKYKVNSLKKGMKLTVKIKPFKLSNGKRVYGKVTKKTIIVKK